MVNISWCSNTWNGLTELCGHDWYQFVFSGSNCLTNTKTFLTYSWALISSNKASTHTGKPSSLSLSYTRRSIMHACTHQPSPLLSQTTMAISMRIVCVVSEHCGPSICCTMWLPFRDREITRLMEGKGGIFYKKVNSFGISVYSTEGLNFTVL